MRSITSIILGLSFVLGLATLGYFTSQIIVNGHTAVNTAEVKGLAERRVTADFAQAALYFEVEERQFDANPYTNDARLALRSKAAEAQTRIIEQLIASGIAQEEIKTDFLRYGVEEFRNDENLVVERRHSVAGNVKIASQDISIVEKLQTTLDELTVLDIRIVRVNREYRFTGLNDIKPDMLREATQNARIAAEQFAQNAGVSVGGIQYARQGGFEVSDWSEPYSQTNEPEKLVRVVTTVSFYLEN